MADERWRHIRDIFDNALRRPPGERQRFVCDECAGDDALLAEVQSLLASLDSAESFMETPAVTHVAGAMEAAAEPVEKGKRFGHYEIVKRIGSGGMGDVYLAQDTRLDRKVAVKILNEKFNRDPANLSRFVREAKAASALNHPNILVIHEIGETDRTKYIVSEYVAGQTLRDVFRERTLQMDEILDISIQTAGALCTAHDARLIHRDIKPENIMIRPDGYVKILDFGLAKLVERKNRSILGLDASTVSENQTAKGVILGTINYMSPEQAKGEHVDERTDIFSLGAVLYEMIACRTPFGGDSVAETLANLINQEPKPLSDIAADVPDALTSLIGKMLSKKAADRHETMNQVLTELKAMRDNVPSGEKLGNAVGAEHENATIVMHAATGDANLRTAETHYSLFDTIKQPRSIAAITTAVVLTAMLAVGAYLFYPVRPTLGADGKRSIAVLPLRPISAAARDDIYEIGIADSLIIRLGSIAGFVVRPLSATRRYGAIDQDPLEAGKELKVDYVLASNYQVSGAKIRVTAQLFNVTTGQIEETYKGEKDASDIFAMQDAIAGEIGNLLLSAFATGSNTYTPRRGTTNEEAYRLYLQGKNMTSRRTETDAQRAIEYFEQAIALDPNFARAYTGLAYAYRASGSLGGGHPREQFAKAKQAVIRALELDSTLADAYAVRGDIRLKVERDFIGGEKDLIRAIELEPNNDLAYEIYAEWFVHTGRIEDALKTIDRSLEIDPRSLINQRNRGRVLYFARRYDDAILQLERVIEVDKNFRTAYGWLWMAYAMKGDRVKAFEVLVEFAKKSDPEHVVPLQTAYETAGWEALLRKQLELRKTDEHLPESNYYAIARLSAMLGEKEQAFEYLNKAIEKGQSQIVMLNVEPAFDLLRGDPRYEEMIKRRRAEMMPRSAALAPVAGIKQQLYHSQYLDDWAIP